jgi:hypothetical protein
MPKVTYKAPPGDAETLKWGGQEFKNGEAVDVKNPAILQKAQNNPYFEVSGAEKGEKQDAVVVGDFKDANSNQEYNLIRKPAQNLYGSGPGPAEIAKPSSATQGSIAVEAVRPIIGPQSSRFEDDYGVKQEDFAKGDYEGAPEFKGPEGTVGSAKHRGRPPGSGKK